MQRKEFFRSSWNDITQSPSWYIPLIKLGLLSLIPIFGQIVVCSYLYGWARDIAWNHKTDLPQKIFENKDGRFWARGLQTFFYSLAVGILSTLAMFALMAFGIILIAGGGISAVLAGIYFLCLLLTFIPALIIVSVFIELGALHIAIYNSFGAGFKFKRFYKMMLHKKEWTGRLIALTLFVQLAAMLVVSFVLGINQLLGLGSAGIFFTTGSVAAGGGALLLSSLVGGFINSCVGTFANLLIARAYGYYIAGFDVPSWGGQEDPLPFELPKEEASLSFNPEASSSQEEPAAERANSAQEDNAPSQDSSVVSEEPKEGAVKEHKEECASKSLSSSSSNLEDAACAGEEKLASDSSEDK